MYEKVVYVYKRLFADSMKKKLGKEACAGIKISLENTRDNSTGVKIAIYLWMFTFFLFINPVILRSPQLSFWKWIRARYNFSIAEICISPLCHSTLSSYIREYGWIYVDSKFCDAADGKCVQKRLAADRSRLENYAAAVDTYFFSFFRH